MCVNSCWHRWQMWHWWLYLSMCVYQCTHSRKWVVAHWYCRQITHTDSIRLQINRCIWAFCTIWYWRRPLMSGRTNFILQCNRSIQFDMKVGLWYRTCVFRLRQNNQINICVSPQLERDRRAKYCHTQPCFQWKITAIFLFVRWKSTKMSWSARLKHWSPQGFRRKSFSWTNCWLRKCSLIEISTMCIR